VPGLGVIVNVVAIVVGTAIGLVFGGLIHDRMRDTAFRAIGLSTIVIGAGMAIGGLNTLGKSHMGDYAPLVLVGALVLGGIIGEALRIEYYLEQFGHWLQGLAGKMPFLAPTPKTDEPNAKGHTLVEGFVTASLLFCVGAMTVLGSIQDGLGNPSTLYLKATLDGVASIALASTLGVGVGLSILPVIVIQGGIALGASSMRGVVTPEVIAAIQATGGALILGIGFDLAGIKRLPVGNLLPSILLAALAAVWLG
jgi:uncharacterized membrane protein YqgA involved in biofilm formation